MSNQPKISVILPVYNVEEYITRCIESLQAQTLKDIEFIFIDDCGNDDSICIVEKFAAHDDRIKILYNEENIGAGKSRNKGIDAATGEYIGFVDPDDWIDSNFYEVLYDTAKSRNYDIVKGRRIKVIYMKNGRISYNESLVNVRIKDKMREKCPLFCVFTSEHQTAIFNRDMVHKFNIYNGSSSHSENSVFLLSASFHAKRFCIDSRVSYYYFQRKGSSVHTFDYKMFSGELESFHQQMEFLRNIPELSGSKDLSLFLERKIKFLINRYNDLHRIHKLKLFRKEFAQAIINELSQIENIENLKKCGFKTRLLLDGKVNIFVFINKFNKYNSKIQSLKKFCKIVSKFKNRIIIKWKEQSLKKVYKIAAKFKKWIISKWEKRLSASKATKNLIAGFDFSRQELIYLQNHRGCIIFNRKFLEVNQKFALDYINSFKGESSGYNNNFSVDSENYKEHLSFMSKNEICWRYSKRFGFISKTALSLDKENRIWFRGEIMGGHDFVDTEHFFVRPQTTRKLIEGIPLNQYIKRHKKSIDDELRRYTDFIFETFKTDNPETLQGIAYDAFPFNCIISGGHKYNLFDLEFEFKGEIQKGYMIYKIVRGVPRNMQKDAYFKLCEHYSIIPKWDYWDDFDFRIWLDTILTPDKNSNNTKEHELFNKYFG